jgi:hypothetical protein
MNEYLKAVEEYRLAEEGFLWADPEFVYAAVLRLESAKQRLNSIIIAMKKGELNYEPSGATSSTSSSQSL